MKTVLWPWAVAALLAACGDDAVVPDGGGDTGDAGVIGGDGAGVDGGCAAGEALCSVDDGASSSLLCVDLSSYCGSCERYAACSIGCDLPSINCCSDDCSAPAGCAYIDTDETNCGGCRVVCPAGEYCVEGECSAPR